MGSYACTEVLQVHLWLAWYPASMPTSVTPILQCKNVNDNSASETIKDAIACLQLRL